MGLLYGVKEIWSWGSEKVVAYIVLGKGGRVPRKWVEVVGVGGGGIMNDLGKLDLETGRNRVLTFGLFI